MSNTPLRSSLLRVASELPVGDPTRRKILSSLKEARTVGLVAEVLGKYWNIVHDMEHAIESTIHEYDTAASYIGGPARPDALKMVKEIKAVLKTLDNLSSKEFNRLSNMEDAFVRKYGPPDEYTIEQRNEMFPH